MRFNYVVGQKYLTRSGHVVTCLDALEGRFTLCPSDPYVDKSSPYYSLPSSVPGHGTMFSYRCKYGNWLAQQDPTPADLICEASTLYITLFGEGE